VRAGPAPRVLYAFEAERLLSLPSGFLGFFRRIVDVLPELIVQVSGVIATTLDALAIDNCRSAAMFATDRAAIDLAIVGVGGRC
jgi:hypothetical protein